MERCQNLRLPGVPDSTGGGGADEDVFAVRGRDVLLRRARHSALADAREPLPRSSLGIATTMRRSNTAGVRKAAEVSG